MPDSPPPAYSQYEDDPFVHDPSTPTQAPLTQPPSNQATLDPRARFGYGPEILAPQDLVEPVRTPANGKFYVVPKCPAPGIVGSWALANDLTLHVPGGTPKGHKTWDSALNEYTIAYNNGVVKVVYPRTPTATPGHSVTTPVIVRSTATTPSTGTRVRPIELLSSPAVTPTRVSGRSAARSAVMSPGARGMPIFVNSSPATTYSTPTLNPVTPTRQKESVQCTVLSSATAPSTPTVSPTLHTSRDYKVIVAEPSRGMTPAWRNQTPVSIPGARLFNTEVSSSNLDGRDSASESDGEESSDTDDEYFKNYRMSREDRDALFEALADPRFDLP